MEKKLEKIKTVAIILIGILLIVVAFGGAYIKKNGVWENIFPNYKYGMELGGYRELHFVLDDSENEKKIYVDENGNYMGDVKEDSSSSETEDNDVSVSMLDEDGNPIENPEISEDNKEETEEENDTGYKTETRTIKANPEEEITISNFEKSKKIVQERIEKMKGALNEYNIRQNTVTGEIILEVPDNDNLGAIESLVLKPGKLTITDYQNGVLLMDDSHVKSAKLLGNQTEDGYQIYLQVEFDKEGKEILRNISTTYVKTISIDAAELQKTDEDTNTTEETETEEEADTNTSSNESISYITVNIDDTPIVSTYFGQEIGTGVLQLPYGQAYEEYSEYLKNANNAAFIATAVDTESLPLVYKLSSDNYINTSINNNVLFIVAIVFASLIFLVSIVMLIMYKSKSIKYIGLGLIYIALISLVCRYTNVVITINSLIVYLSVIVLNYWFYFQLLSKQKNGVLPKDAYKQTMKKMYLAIVPVIIIAVVFTFMSSVVTSSIGMLLFWGLVIQALTSLLA